MGPEIVPHRDVLGRAQDGDELLDRLERVRPELVAHPLLDAAGGAALRRQVLSPGGVSVTTFSLPSEPEALTATSPRSSRAPTILLAAWRLTPMLRPMSEMVTSAVLVAEPEDPPVGEPALGEPGPAISASRTIW